MISAASAEELPAHRPNGRSTLEAAVATARAAAKRKRLFTHATRKETALYVRSAIMPIPSEVASYDFRP
jgi:hypothetical protein